MKRAVKVWAAAASSLLPLAIGGVWLVDGLCEEQTGPWFLPLLIPTLVLAPLVAWTIARRSGLCSEARTPLVVGLLVPCFLVPLAVTAPWAVVPDPLGVGYGGFGLFLHWLTKYPNFGPVNYEVSFGILCVLGASSLPVGFGLYRIFAKTPRGWILALLLALHLIAFVPVFIRLDLGQLLYTSLVARMGPLTIVGDPGQISLPARLAIASNGAGALYRLVATLCMILSLILGMRGRAPSSAGK